MRWWYTFTLATFAFAFAIGLFARRNSLMPAPDDLLMTFCQPPKETAFLDNDAGGYITCFVSGGAWAGLLVGQLASSLPPRFPAVEGRLARIKQRLMHGHNRFWARAAHVYWFLIELCLFALSGYHTSQLVLILDGIHFGDAGN
ncbi:hypothetical protein B0H63DRAFT_515800 [Podospora didyma]|uniref:Uncharacterized protein n=1 Tax=Podospora didyma TaxID=330526 RepID=A0AAE0JZI7_9PEZI|nr:hypothetical protein B0H63DRAFT_515800 [Podospora didyma]